MEVSPNDLLPQAIERARQPLDEAIDTLIQIIYVTVLVAVFVGIFIPLLSATSYAQLDDIANIAMKIDPYLFASLGMGIVISFSVVGAAW